MKYRLHVTFTDLAHVVQLMNIAGYVTHEPADSKLRNCELQYVHELVQFDLYHVDLSWSCQSFTLAENDMTLIMLCHFPCTSSPSNGKQQYAHISLVLIVTFISTYTLKYNN